MCSGSSTDRRDWTGRRLELGKLAMADQGKWRWCKVQVGDDAAKEGAATHSSGRVSQPGQPVLQSGRALAGRQVFIEGLPICCNQRKSLVGAAL